MMFKSDNYLLTFMVSKIRVRIIVIASLLDSSRGLPVPMSSLNDLFKPANISVGLLDIIRKAIMIIIQA
jgi:hypothetical protein